jgi:hypothetical protein
LGTVLTRGIPPRKLPAAHSTPEGIDRVAGIGSRLLQCQILAGVIHGRGLEPLSRPLYSHIR